MPSSVVMPETGNMYSKLQHSPSTGFIPEAWRKQMDKLFLDNRYQSFMAALLMISLFMPDGWILGNARDFENDRLYGVLLAVFIIFMIETLVMCVFVKNYIFSFSFFVDIIGNLSMIIDIGWISESFLPTNTIATQGSIVRATRAAKLGARYGRLLRLLRIVRLVKKLPCYKRFIGEESDPEPTLSAIKKVSEELGDTLAIRTAILILILVIVLPFFTYSVTDYSATSWITNFKIATKNETVTFYDISNLARKCSNFYSPKDASLYYLYIESPYVSHPFEQTYPTRNYLRDENILTYESAYYIANSTLAQSGNSYALQSLANAAANGRDDLYGFVQFQVKLKLDNSIPNQTNAMYNILTLVLIIVLLLGFTTSFNDSVNKLVVKPLERMMTTLRNSAMVMLKTMKALENANKEDDEEDGKKEKKTGEEDEEDEDIETAMLEKMIEKLARIMSHVLPNNNEIDMDGNMDGNTANWLKQSYNANVVTKTTKIHRTESTAQSEDLEKLRLKQLESSLSATTRALLSTWDFDVLSFGVDELQDVVVYIFSLQNLLQEFRVPETILRTFLKEISERYINTNTYHNYKHGVDVFFTAYRLLVIPGLDMALSTLEVFSVLVGALAHDVGHIGVNNLFLVKTKHTLAIQHNDRSPLENMHCVVLYELLRKDSTNIFVNLDEKQWREARKIILTIILGTDMSHHFEQISKTQLFNEVNGEDTKAFCAGQKEEIECFRDEKNRLFVMELVLHCSDISNPFKPFAICAKWADLVVEEFCLQGDQEKALGVEVSPMCDRDQINLCNMQMGFIEFVVAPLIIAFVNVFPPLHEIGSNMLNNFQSWGERRKLDIMEDMKSTADKPEECRKVDERLGKFSDKLNFVSGYRELPIRRRSSQTRQIEL